MELRSYPRPPADTGWGFHDTAGADNLPGNTEAEWRAFARQLHQECGVTWYKLLASGRNKVGLAKALRDEGIMPIVRLYAPEPNPGYIVTLADVAAYAAVGAPYIEHTNESNLRDEWPAGEWDKGAQPDRVAEQWVRNQAIIRQGGAIPCLPALSPGGHYPHRKFYRTFFEWLRIHGQLGTLQGAAVAIHNRPFNHPLDYQDDSGCQFLDYQWVGALVRSYAGHYLPLLGTEAGYEPGWAQDTRYPPISLELHAKYNLAILDSFRPVVISAQWDDFLFCQCMWLLEEMGHRHDGFAPAIWRGNRVYGGDLPALGAMKASWKAKPFQRGFSWDAEPAPPPGGPTPGPTTPTITKMLTRAFGYPTAGTPGRQGHKVIAVVLHRPQGTLGQTDGYVQAPANGASYHYCVYGRAIHQYVEEKDASWGAGKVDQPSWPLLKTGENPNLYIINVAVAGYSGDPISEDTYQSLLWLVRGILQRHGVQAGLDTVIGHCRVNSVDRGYCPGPGPWGRLFAELRGASLPEDILAVTLTPPAPIMADKGRWWAQELKRQLEAGNVGRAEQIAGSLPVLLGRLENVLEK